MRITVDVDDREMRALFAIVKIKLKTFYPVFLQQRQYLSTAFMSNFATGGQFPGSGGWRPEKPGPWSAAQGMPAYLFRTGNLMASMAAMRGQVADIGDKEARLGIYNVPYAKFHQWGTEQLPSRKLIFIPAGYSRKFAKDVKDWVVPAYKSGQGFRGLV